MTSTPDPLADVRAPLRDAMTRRGFTSLTPVQRAVLAADSRDRDLRISSQTGSGKTVAIGIALSGPLLEERDTAAPPDAPPTSPGSKTGVAPRPGPLALIITPTRELAVQVRDELRWLLADVPGTSIEAVTGGTDIRGERRLLRRPPRVLVATPGRLLDHMRSGVVSCTAVEHVVLDEADRMLDMGFRDELDAIIDELPERRRSHLVSATFSGPMRHIADKFQRDALHLQGSALGEAHGDIDHVGHLVDKEDLYAALANALLLAQGQRVLVFVERRDTAATLAERLAGDGFPALPFSGDLSQPQRTRTLNAFRSGTIGVLVSTDVAARGIDVPDITVVVHMSVPQSTDDYTHRSGRTGRAGRRGRSLLLVPPRGQRWVSRLLSRARIDIDWQPVPTPARVRKAITKRTRKQLRARLEGDQQPSEKSLAYAAQLLEGHDAAKVVATLLEQAEPALPREPMVVRAMTPPADAGGAREHSGSHRAIKPRRPTRGRNRRFGHRGRRRPPGGDS